MTEAWRHWEGRVVDGIFHLGRYLGGGKYSAVFLTEYGAQEPRKAAIKLISEDHPDLEQLRPSIEESIAKWSHPHLLRLFQTGRCRLGDTAALYVVMECAEVALSQVIPQRPLTPDEAREMLVPTLDALDYLHGKGMVHGHLKPTNILSVDDQLKISSDGLYRTGETRSSLQPMGAYDPPEMADGHVSAAGDVWALGMTLVEVLTQSLPVWTRQGDPVVPTTLPDPFQDIARHCLQQDPQRRWRVKDIAARLSQSSEPGGQTVDSPRRFAQWRYLVPAAFALALVAMLAVPRLWNRPPPPTPSAAPTTDKSNQKQAVPLTPEPSPMPAAPKASASGSIPGKVVKQVLPDVPRKARETIQGKVRVHIRIRVDSSGRVMDAKIDSPKASRYFAQLALHAAQRWQFAAPKINGRNVSSSWILQFEFDRTATKVHPARVQ